MRSVQWSVHIHVFIARQSAWNGECQIKKGLMGIASLLKGLRVIFEQVFGFMLIMSKNSKNRMSFFMHTVYLNIENINEYIDLVYKGWVDEWMKDIII